MAGRTASANTHFSAGSRIWQERYGAQIIFDQEARTPYFEYTDEKGNDHIVWFENQQSWRERIALVEEYGLEGIGIWNIMEIFPGKVPGVI